MKPTGQEADRATIRHMNKNITIKINQLQNLRFKYLIT